MAKASIVQAQGPQPSCKTNHLLAISTRGSPQWLVTPCCNSLHLHLLHLLHFLHFLHLRHILHLLHLLHALLLWTYRSGLECARDSTPHQRLHLVSIIGIRVVRTIRVVSTVVTWGYSKYSEQSKSSEYK